MRDKDKFDPSYYAYTEKVRVPVSTPVEGGSGWIEEEFKYPPTITPDRRVVESYKILWADDPDKLRIQVINLMGSSTGPRWEPQGGVCISQNLWFYQAMVAVS